MTSEKTFWLAWAQITGVGPILLQRLQNHFGSLAVAWEANVEQLGVIEGFGPQLLRRVAQERSQVDPARLLSQHRDANPCFWTPEDTDYPKLLLEIPSPPPVLYVQGDPQIGELVGQVPVIGIVGTRDPSEYGRRWTRKLSAALAEKGFVVASGMAEGIDTEAHLGCLAAGGRTIAVLGTGVDVIYPRRNQQLYKRILTQGWVCSEHPAGTQPDRSHFPRRNRIIAGLGRALLVTEAPRKSGALITAYMANDFCRDVYVLPGSLDNERSIGCLGLLSRGAQVILGEGHLLELLGSMPQVDIPAPPNQLTLTSSPDLAPEVAQVLEAIALDPTSFDRITSLSGLPASTVSSALLQLELEELVTQLPGMHYQRIGS